MECPRNRRKADDSYRFDGFAAIDTAAEEHRHAAFSSKKAISPPARQSANSSKAVS
jgi:hypothetical protein